jgi:hypothetical protein
MPDVAGVEGLDGRAELVGILCEAGEVFTVVLYSIVGKTFFDCEIAQEFFSKRRPALGVHWFTDVVVVR